MTSMIEKAARAIATCGKMPKAYEQQAWEVLCREQPKMAAEFRVQAQAVLDALQDPTDAMIDAAINVDPPTLEECKEEPWYRAGQRKAFKAMIKAAGEEGT